MADEFKGARNSWTTDIADTDSAQAEAMEAVTKALPATYSAAAHLATSAGGGVHAARAGSKVGRPIGAGVGLAARFGAKAAAQGVGGFAYVGYRVGRSAVRRTAERLER